DNNIGMRTLSYGEGYSLPHVVLHKVKNPADFPLVTDTTMSITKFPGRGARVWAPANWAANANASSRGMIWLAHFNRANVLFADGHAEASDPGRLLRTSIVNKKVQGELKYGITHYATEDFKQQAQNLLN